VVTIKKVTNADTGTADIIGGDDWDSVAGLITDGFPHKDLKVRDYTNTYYGQIMSPVLSGSALLDIGYQFNRYLVYLDNRDNKYTLKSGRTGHIQAQATTPDAILQEACDLGEYSYVEIKDGAYPIAATSGTLFKMHLNQHVRLSKGARIQVPQGFTGTVFSFNNSNSGATTPDYGTLEGGFLEELGTVQRLWTGVELNSTSNVGVVFNHVRGMRIQNPLTGVLLKCDGATSFTSGNTISDMTIVTPKNFYDFQLANSGTLINANSFFNNRNQADSNALYGYKNITGKYNSFFHNYIYDLPNGSVSSNILSSAQSTLIVGGFMDHTEVGGATFTDAGVGTIRITGDIGINGMKVPTVEAATSMKNNGYTDFVAMSAPASPSTGTIRQYAKTVDANNDGFFRKVRVNGAVVEVEF
jgi:hypothetical protein